MFTLLAAVACIVFGAKLIVISVLGSPMPVLDQWDAEAASLYSPYLKGTLSLADLFAAHNEHRIFLTRVLALANLELAGEWNTRLEMVLNAVIHTALITWLAALLMPLVAPQRRLLVAGFTAFLFAVPIAYENTLWGLQSELYLTLFFGVAALVAFASARPFSWRWFGGLAAAVLSYLSYASGTATIFAACALVGLQLATKARKRCGREIAAFAVMASIALVTMLWEASTAKSTTSLWAFAMGFLGFLVFAVLTGPGAVPTVWWCRHTLARRPALSEGAWVVVGIACWVAIQLVLIAYGREGVFYWRYWDIVLLVYPVALVAVLTFADEARATRFKRYVTPRTAKCVFALVAAAGVVGCYGAIDWNKAARQHMVSVQAYLATNDIDRLPPRGVHGFGTDLAFPNPQQLAKTLGDRDVRAILPPEIRPPGGDNAGARNRMLLKGALAGVTATAVRLVLAMGPALLALGGVFLLRSRNKTQNLPGRCGDGVTRGAVD